MSGIVQEFNDRYQVFNLGGKALLAEVCLDITFVQEWYENFPPKAGAQYNFDGGDYRVYYICGAIQRNSLLLYFNQFNAGPNGNLGVCAIDVGGVVTQLSGFTNANFPPYWSAQQAEDANKGSYIDITLPAGLVTYGYRNNSGFVAPPGSGRIRYAFVKK